MTSALGERGAQRLSSTIESETARFVKNLLNLINAQVKLKMEQAHAAPLSVAE